MSDLAVEFFVEKGNTCHNRSDGKFCSIGGGSSNEGVGSKEVLSVVGELPGLQNWLAKSGAVKKVVFTKDNPTINTMRGPVQIAGGYDYEKHQVVLSNKFGTSDYGKPFKSGVQSVASAAKTPVEYQQRLLVHELGHAVMEKGGLDYGILKHFNGVGSVSKYGNIDRSEHFAETFSAFVFHRAELKKADPTAASAMTRALRQVGIS